MKRPSAPTEVTDIRFERADKGLGLSIAGGLGSTPYKDNDEGIFISRVTVGGPAHAAGLRKDDKVIMGLLQPPGSRKLCWFRK